MDPIFRPEPRRAAVGERWPLALRTIAGLLVLTLVTYLAIAVAKGRRERQRRARLVATVERMQRLGESFESTPVSKRPRCVRSANDFLMTSGSDLPLETTIDAWGNGIGLVASDRRYIVFSLGSDRTADRERPGGGVDSDAADLVYSNGEWLQHPSAMTTMPGDPPRPDEAFAELGDCSQLP